ncbi:MAG: DEAD/DEAH box helicase [Zetaproteobacteria bacterium]|nr:DEAD/DEAH box helicase [Zetaproteobacteria bacterium]
MSQFNWETADFHAFKKFIEAELSRFDAKIARKGLKTPAHALLNLCIDTDSITAKFRQHKSLLKVQYQMNIHEPNSPHFNACDCESENHLDEQQVRCHHKWAVLHHALQIISKETAFKNRISKTDFCEELLTISHHTYPQIPIATGTQSHIRWVLQKNGQITPWVRFWNSHQQQWGNWKQSLLEEELLQTYSSEAQAQLEPLLHCIRQSEPLSSNYFCTITSLLQSLKDLQLECAWEKPDRKVSLSCQPFIHNRLHIHSKGCSYYPLTAEEQEAEVHLLGNSIVLCYFGSKQVLKILPIPKSEKHWFHQLLTHSSSYIPWEKHYTTRQILHNIQQHQKIILHNIADTLSEQQRPASARWCLRVRPHESTIIGVILIQEFDGAAYLIPGHGPKQVYDVLPEQITEVSRDFSVEESHIAFIRKLSEPYILPHTAEKNALYWSSTEQFVLFLAALEANRHALKERSLFLSIEWPEDINFKPQLTSFSTHDDKNLHIELIKGNDWFNIRGGIYIDGTYVSLQILLTGFLSHKRYIQIDENKWMFLAESLKKQLEQIATCLDYSYFSAPERIIQHGDVLPVAKHAQLCTLFQQETDESNLALNDEVTHRLQKLETDKLVRATLLTHQKAGVRWLLERSLLKLGCILADDMGLGKTLQTLATLAALRSETPHLILVPTSLVHNWESETQKFVPHLRVHNVHTCGDFTKSDGLYDIVLASYGLFTARQEQFVYNSWHSVILDEAHKAKNSQSQLAKGLKLLSAEHFIGLTGTPIENNLSELWSIFHILQPDLLGNTSNFQGLFGEKGKDQGIKILRKRIQPFVLRRMKEDYLHELPTKQEINCKVYLSDRERKRYDDFRMEAIACVALNQKKPSTTDTSSNGNIQVLQHLQKLRTWCSYPTQIEGSWTAPSAKEKALWELLEDKIFKQHKCLIFSQFPRFLKHLQQQLEKKGIPSHLIDGQTPRQEREYHVQEFQQGQGDVFLISLKAGGVGLNLTAADTVIHLDPWWNPTLEDQASCRAHRMGQTKTVTVYRFYCPLTIEENILKLHSTKRDLANAVLETKAPQTDTNFHDTCLHLIE